MAPADFRRGFFEGRKCGIICGVLGHGASGQQRGETAMLKKRAAKGAIAACAAMALVGAYAAVPAFTGVTNYWVGADWADYGAAANWRVNDPDAGANAVPTANDMIYLNDATTYKFDLGGQPWTVGRIAKRADQFYSGSGAGSGLIEVTNGSLTVSTLVAFKMRLNVWDGGTFSLDAPNLFFHHGAVDAY